MSTSLRPRYAAQVAISGLLIATAANVACGTVPERDGATAQRVISGADNRTEIVDWPNTNVRNVARQVGLIAPKPSYLYKNGQWDVDYSSYETASQNFNLCSTERFAGERVVGNGTAYLVSPGRVVTAGHTLELASDDLQTFCENFHFIFTYQTDASGALAPFTASQEYNCRFSLSQGDFASFPHHKVGNIDYAVIDLDRPVTDANGDPVPGFVAADSDVERAQPVLMVGYGAGLPSKVSPGFVTSFPYDESPNSPDLFGIDCDGFPGNSGSPVFDVTTVEVYGTAVVGHDGDGEVTDGASPCSHWAKIPSGETIGVAQIGQAMANHFAPATGWTGGDSSGVSGTVRAGDVNGDGRDDLVFFTDHWSLTSGHMVVSVSNSSVRLSDGSKFDSTSQVQNGLCMPGEQCFVVDIDGDGRADIVALSDPLQPAVTIGARAPGIYVALSDGMAFVPPSVGLPNAACLGDEVCKVADVDGDGKADIIAFDRATTATGQAGDVYVTLAMPFGPGFAARTLWESDFCTGSDTCEVADINGDRRADIIDFTENTRPSPANGQSHAALATKGRFAPAKLWQSDMCAYGGACVLGDVNGDGRADAVSLDLYPGTDIRTTGVALAKNGSFGLTNDWNSDGCLASETCLLADVNGDGRKDLVAVDGPAVLRVGLATPRFVQ